MKPLARWTVGCVNESGIQCLRYSVRTFRRVYPEFDLVICYNNVKGAQLQQLRKLDVGLYSQSTNDLEYPLTSQDSPPGWKYSMPGWGWKLCPPRLRIGSHELWIDNDIVIRDRLPTLDDWLKKDTAIISECHRREYGIYDELISEPTPCCAGFFGLPPNFDFNQSILKYCKLLKGPLGYYDEQGVTTCSVTSMPYAIIPAKELAVIKSFELPAPPGLHFIGLNRTNPHEAWESYKSFIFRFI